eukprot:TRINITY_DN2910_c0_g1_i2.p1 TRINITY_DN2910_c0_g1~~TRINITY_DN2910_c0_g1_i2.p1  ORF type:complete len:296 (-),score=88.30 TRINITY_DN2910_c0_g1_i2:228-1115(-)
MKQLVNEINVTSISGSFFGFVNNAERQLFVDSKYTILNSNAQTVAVNNINELYNLDSQVHQEHSINVNILNEDYKNEFNQVMMLNPCPVVVNQGLVTDATCQTFADGSVYQGLAVALTRHFENLRYLLTLYVKYSTNASATFDNINTIKYMAVTQSQQRNNILNIMNLQQAVEIDTLQTLYIKHSFRFLMDRFITSLDNQFNSDMASRLALLIAFNILLLIIYLIVWLPLVNRLNKNIWRTKSMLTMIPLNVVAKIKSVRVFLKKFLNEKNISAAQQIGSPFISSPLLVCKQTIT